MSELMRYRYPPPAKTIIITLETNACKCTLPDSSVQKKADGWFNALPYDMPIKHNVQTYQILRPTTIMWRSPSPPEEESLEPPTTGSM
eukprot:scaffold2627_cov85-Skeletonema_dohrnii-CCMP3373.AAC.1